MADIRTFIAVDMPQETKMALDKLVSELRPLGPDIRWVKAANLHLTLRFIGDMPEKSVRVLAAALGKNLADHESFPVILSGLGGFPNIRRPRVIWVGTSDGTEKLIGLATSVERACRECGLDSADKPFSSHLTIGRVKFPKGHEKLITYAESTKFELEPFNASEVVIFKSDLSPSGPKYTRLETIELK